MTNCETCHKHYITAPDRTRASYKIFTVDWEYGHARLGVSPAPADGFISTLICVWMVLVGVCSDTAHDPALARSGARQKQFDRGQKLVTIIIIMLPHSARPTPRHGHQYPHSDT